MTDEELSPRIAALRPEPRADLVARTLLGVEAAARRRRRLRWSAGAGTAGLAVAAAVVVLVLRGPAEEGPGAPGPAPASAYVVRLAEDASRVTPGGLAQLLATPVPPGTRVQTASGGRVVLEDGAERVVALAGSTYAEIQMNQVRLEAGAARLEGAARIGSPLASLTGLDPTSQAELTLGGRDLAMKNPAAVTLAAAATLLSVHVAAGRVRVDTPSGSLVLGPGDRQLVPARGPALLLRARPPRGGEPARGPELTKRAPAGAASPGASATAAPGVSLDKEVIRTGIIEIVPKVKQCYDEGLKRDPSLKGRLVVEFVIAAQDGQGRITTAEVQSGEDDDEFMNAPLTAQCVLQALGEAHFPPPEGGGVVHVTYPFTFSSEE